MREILFRGKAANREDGRQYRTSYKNGDWVYGLLTDPLNYAGFAEMTNTIGVSGIEVDENTVGQFTGLWDSTKWEELTQEEQNAFLHQPDGWENTEDVWHGKQIFEGDIVQAHFRNNHSKQTFCVIFGDGMFLFDNFYVKVPKYDIYCMKVIGNIHDNPELLEGYNEQESYD